MKKLAIFSEGQTEQLFLVRLLEEVAGLKNISFHLCRGRGGGKVRKIETVEMVESPSSKFFVLIYDSGCDNRVASDVRDHYQSLVKNGYSKIIAIRDVFPDFKINELNILRSRLGYGIKTNPIKVCFVLSVMEFEAWLLAEHTHYQRVSSQITIKKIISKMGFDPSKDDLQLRPVPTSDINSIYNMGGVKYEKSQNKFRKILDRIDFGEIYLNTRGRFPDLNKLIDELDIFLA